MSQLPLGSILLCEQTPQFLERPAVPLNGVEDRVSCAQGRSVSARDVAMAPARMVAPPVMNCRRRKPRPPAKIERLVV
jgi:hypothetical protein